MKNLPGDPNLPPGVSQKEIERSFGIRNFCEACGFPTASNNTLCKSCQRKEEEHSELSSDDIRDLLIGL